MKKSNKTFKIGEYAIGGIIEVNIFDALITIKAKDWDTKKVLNSESFTKLQGCEITNFLNELTTYYYAEKVFDWIETKVEIQY